MASPRRSGGSEVADRGQAGDEEERLADPEQRPHQDERAQAVDGQVGDQRDDRQDAAEEQVGPTPEAVRRPAHDRTQSSAAIENAPIPTPDADGVRAERPVDEPGGHRQDDAAGREEGQDRDPQRGERRGAQARR